LFKTQYQNRIRFTKMLYKIKNKKSYTFGIELYLCIKIFANVIDLTLHKLTRD
jgi:hypothetical protein